MITIEIALATMVVCLAHLLKPKVGLTGLFVVVGVFTAYLFVAGRPEGLHPTATGILWPTGIEQTVSMAYLPTILVSFVLVYVLESTHAARQLIYAVALVYVVAALLDLQVDFHATHPAPGRAPRPDGFTPWLDLPSRLVSLVALAVDAVVIIASYQWLVSKLPRLPLAVPLFVALVLAMLVDAIVYGGLYLGAFSLEGLQVPQKVVTGIAAGLPAALYFHWRIRALPPSTRRGLFERGPLEIVLLKKEVELQRKRYESVKQTFGRYVSPEVVELLTADPSKLQLGGEERDVAILFADMRGYSTVSEGLSPTDTLALLNRFFDRVNRVVQAHRGMVNNFLGDGVLAVFGAPLPVERHSERALRAALDLLASVAELDRELEREGALARWRAVGLDGIGVRIGLHAGRVVVGNLGNEQRTDYAVIGDVVNTAARLEALGKPLGVDLLVSDALYRELADPALRARLVPLGAHQVKGRQEAVEVYTLAPRAPPT